MSKLSKQQVINNLIEIYASDTSVRDAMIPQIKQECENIHQTLGIPPVDWGFLHLPAKLQTTNPEVYFTRLMEIYFALHGEKWIRELYKRNKQTA